MEHSHTTLHNKMVKTIIKKLSKQFATPYSMLKNRIIGGEGGELIQRFWMGLYEDFPETKIYNQLYFCSGCKMFELEIEFE